jgi:hypothetical protein
MCFGRTRRLLIVQESQPAKNRNLSRLLSNISRLNLSRNCVYCFSTVFTLLQEQEVPTISKITVRPQEIETGGTGVTPNYDNEALRGSDSVFCSLIRALQNRTYILIRTRRCPRKNGKEKKKSKQLTALFEISKFESSYLRQKPKTSLFRLPTVSGPSSIPENPQWRATAASTVPRQVPRICSAASPGISASRPSMPKL